jgi:hypothetical protein
MILPDTDHLSVLRFRTGARCIRLVARLEAVKDEVVGTTIINVFPHLTAKIVRTEVAMPQR